MNYQLFAFAKNRCLRSIIAFSMMVVMLAGTIPLYASPINADIITVLPIDRAKFLAGQKFDFAIEVKSADAPQALQVLVNGQPADKFFGKAAAVNLAAGLSTYRINEVAFNAAGAVKVEVKTGSVNRMVDYQVVAEKAPQKAKNVILFIGDGMSLQFREMARILSKGITEGKYNDLLEMDKMSNLAVITTSGYDSLVTDSANSASAYSTGHKSVVNAMGVYADSTKDPLDDPRVENISEIVKRSRGMSVGLVSTANITDATPAAMVAHTRRRAELNFIAQDMLSDNHIPEVILGGGSRQFLPKSVPGSKRTDERNIIEEFKQKGYSFAGNRAEMKQAPNGKLLGLFQLDNMNVYYDREIGKSPEALGKFTDQPTLMEMTQKAIDTLSQNPNGFFLMVEGASIDKQAHGLDWVRAAYDTIEMDKALGMAKAFAKKNNDTLIVVVADHAHGASITGTYHELDGKKGREAVRIYQEAGWPTFEDKNKDGFPDEPNPDVTLAVQWANHPDYYENYKFNPVPTAPAIMADGKAVANPKFGQGGEFYPGNIPTSDPSEVHAADDIILTADGPGADYFRGVMDNTEVFFGMVRALGLNAVKK